MLIKSSDDPSQRLEAFIRYLRVWPVFTSSGLPESAAAIERLATFFKAHAAH